MSSKLTRQELSAFIPTHKGVVTFENLFSNVESIAELSASIETTATTAIAIAQEAIEAVRKLTQYIDSLPSPQAPETRLQDDLTPPMQIGTMGMQDASRVKITGGNIEAHLINNQVILLETFETLDDFFSDKVATLTNAPIAGNPTKWIKIVEKSIIGEQIPRYIPTW